ncbi:MAG: hypothetical protein AMXMBFR36_28500 [Acidobacteriota bacterium]
MPFRILDPALMGRILAIADEAGVSREAIRVPLVGEGDGRIERDAQGVWQIVLPATGDLEEFLARVASALAGGSNG